MKWFPRSDNSCSTIVYFNINEETPEYGAGLILQNQLYEGRSGSAGELTSPLMDRNALIKQAIEAGYSEIMHHPVFTEAKYISFQALGSAVQNGDEAATFIFNHFITSLAEEIVRIIAFIDPDCIVLGGDIPDLELPLESWLVSEIKEIVNTRFSYGLELPHVQYSPHGRYSGAMGGTSTIFNELFNPNQTDR